MSALLKVNRYYTTHLSKSQITEEVNSLVLQKQFGGLRTDRFISTIWENGFEIQRETSGVDFFTLEQYPAIEGNYISENPTIINVLIRPNYWMIAFFSLFVFTFIPASIFVDEMTINGVTKTPTMFERLFFAAIGAGIPGLWGYFGYIRPIRKAREWIVTRLMLSPAD